MRGRMPRSFAPAAAAVVVLAGFGLVGCGRGQSAPQAWTLVAAAPAKTTDAGTAKFAISATTNLLGQSVHFTGAGVFDFAKRIGQVRVALPHELGGRDVDEIVTADTIYVQIPGVTPDGKFAAVPLAALGGSTNPLAQLGNSDPTAALETLRGASKDVRRLGGATVRGASTTHYRGTIDVATAVQAVPSRLRATVRQVFGSLKQIPFDAYIDPQGRLRRFQQNLTLPDNGLGWGRPVTVASTFDLYDFGTTVHIVAPQTNRVVDGSTLLRQLTRRS